jgi:hypothetical protein
MPVTIKRWLDCIAGDEKFVMTLGAGVVNTLLLVLSYLDQGNYVILTLGTVAAYITGKVVEDIHAGKSPQA